jgi:hypothetical protein
MVLTAILSTDVPAPAARLAIDTPSRIPAPRSGSPSDMQLVNTNPVGGTVMATDSLALSLSVL